MLSSNDKGVHTSLVSQFLYYAIIATIPFYSLRSLSAANPFLKVDWLLMGGLLLLVVPGTILGKRSPATLKSNLWPALLLFFVANLISCLVSPYPEVAYARLGGTIVMGYVFMAVNMVMVTPSGVVKTLPVVLSLSIGLNALFGAMEYFMGFSFVNVADAGERGTGFTLGANNMALMCLFVLPLLMHWVRYAKTRFSALFAVLLFIVNVLGVVSSASRGGFLILMVVGSMVMLSLRKKFHIRYLGIVIAAFGMLAVTAVVMVPEDYIARQATLLQGTDADKSTSRRTDYLVVGSRSFWEHPLVGTGTLTFSKIWVASEETLKYDFTERPAHNTYMEVLVGSGLIGLGMFLLLLGKVWSNFSRARELYLEAEDEFMASLAEAYRLSFVAVCMYLLFKSGLDHKLYLLIIPVSHTVLMMAESGLSVREQRDD